MKKFLNSITNNNIGLLKKPALIEILQSILQGQPYFVILMVMLELVNPLLEPGTSINFSRLVQLTIWLAISLLILFFIGRITYQRESSVAYTVGSEGRLALGEHLKKLSMGFFSRRDPGDITALMLKDYSNVETMISQLLMGAVSSICLPLIFLVFLGSFDWRMTLITAAPIPLACLAAIIARTIIYRLGNIQIKAQNEASSRMLEYIDGMKNIKAYNLHGKKFSRLYGAFQELRKQSIRLEAGTGPIVIVGVWILNVGIALIMLAGIYFVMNGTLSIPYFLVFLIIGTRMYDPLTKLLTHLAELSYHSVSAKRISDIYLTEPLPEPETPSRPQHFTIEFKNVFFRYHENDVLKNVSFHLKENSMTALVGPSGVGKSTITRLIARFWDVNQGEIKIGDIPITEMNNEGLLSQISMVFQDVYLFNDSILSNIKVGNPLASREEVMEAAQKACCHDFIEQLPEGYDTVIGEGGSTLSGGEKQRISIARAILKDAPIVLLDEATASLDPENELHIQKAISELIKGRTLIVIAHRLSTITRADQILVFNNGEIVERGSHQELLAVEKGIYQSMWNEQKKVHTWKLPSGQWNNHNA